MFATALCFGVGLLVSTYGLYIHNMWWSMWAMGVLGGFGLGIGYISPVPTLIKWFPDRPGMATGMAIMGFGAARSFPLGEVSGYPSGATYGAYE